jgi:hypothetical protein
MLETGISDRREYIKRASKFQIKQSMSDKLKNGGHSESGKDTHGRAKTLGSAIKIVLDNTPCNAWQTHDSRQAIQENGLNFAAFPCYFQLLQIIYCNLTGSTCCHSLS